MPKYKVIISYETEVEAPNKTLAEEQAFIRLSSNRRTEPLVAIQQIKNPIMGDRGKRINRRNIIEREANPVDRLEPVSEWD
jgi:hypothetical protein